MDLIKKGLVKNVALMLLAEHLPGAVLANILDGEDPELINCRPPLMPRAGHRLHVGDP